MNKFISNQKKKFQMCLDEWCKYIHYILVAIERTWIWKKIKFWYIRFTIIINQIFVLQKIQSWQPWICFFFSLNSYVCRCSWCHVQNVCQKCSWHSFIFKFNNKYRNDTMFCIGMIVINAKLIEMSLDHQNRFHRKLKVMLSLTKTTGEN